MTSYYGERCKRFRRQLPNFFQVVPATLSDKSNYKLSKLDVWPKSLGG
jgi:hypothetical protein